MTEEQKVRVRFAPSPTGHLHIGGLRTALFNFLFARHTKGTFLIRIEDTDRERSKQEYVESQLASLTWAGITSDEPLVYQSERDEIYKKVLDDLFARHKIYRCTCTPEEVELRVRTSGSSDQFYKYDGHCKSDAMQDAIKTGNKPFVIRFSLPATTSDNALIKINDLIYGELAFEMNQLDDFIIVRSDGTPMYNFVVIVDDQLMAITHVIRGADHISNTPKQVLLYQACGYTPPRFGHIPVIINADGTKMSKRDGAVDVLNYKAQGYVSDAFINYIVRLGWAHGDQEIFTRQELIDSFTLEAIGKKAAVFDSQKLQWLNGVYMRAMDAKTLRTMLLPEVDASVATRYAAWSVDQFDAAIELYKERVKTGHELIQSLDLLYKGPVCYKEDEYKEWITQDAITFLGLVAQTLQNLVDFSGNEISGALKALCKEHDIKLVTVAQPLRIALLGCTSSPGVFDLVAFLGKTETVQRIEKLQQYAQSHQ